MVQPLWRTVWRFLQKLKIELPYDPTILHLGIYPNKTIIQKDAFTPVFTAALFTVTKTWKQPKCPSTGEWIKMGFIYTVEYYSAIKKNEIMPLAATWVDLEIIILSEVNQKEKDKYHVITLNMWNLKFDKWTYLWNKNNLADIENRHVVATGQKWIGSLGLADANDYI